MRTKTAPVDKIFLAIVVILSVFGFFVFLSASLGLLAREGEIFSKVALKQLFYGLVLGLPALYIGMRIPYERWKKIALPFFLFSLLLTALTFIPQIGYARNGSHRWIALMGFSFQPTELLKVGLVLYLSLWFANVKQRASELRYGTLPLLFILAAPLILLVAQPDNDSALILAATGSAIFLVAGGRWRDLGILFLGLLIALTIIIVTRPYVRGRISTFLDPSKDPLGTSYQVRQAIIAVGSGEIVGRGFGQSVQKFNYLPEAVSDSIFAVAAEEFGLLGSIVIVLLYTVFALRGFWLAVRAPDLFSRYIITGFVVVIAAQSFMNIGAMLGLIPLSGQPLIFFSQGGTALVFALFEVGIILGISRQRTHEEG